ncbi:hypothetical protein EYF80_045554 [Liparis tanakae]|uniref:Uncharacterized protein n=1 Tax=Liparis tanakae TaxID=230148 RepID=A0A4Z2FTD3_9TELE|nr:hypothetical protein EYF80_045554 [Liparis tanakae]
MDTLRVTQGDTPKGFLHHFLLRLPTQGRQLHHRNPTSTHLSLSTTCCLRLQPRMTWSADGLHASSFCALTTIEYSKASGPKKLRANSHFCLSSSLKSSGLANSRRMFGPGGQRATQVLISCLTRPSGRLKRSEVFTTLSCVPLHSPAAQTFFLLMCLSICSFLLRCFIFRSFISSWFFSIWAKISALEFSLNS